MDKLKSIGSSLLGLAIFVGFIVLMGLLLRFGADVAFTIAPFVNWLAGVLILLNILAVLVAIVPSTRGSAGAFIFFSSYIYGISTWIYGLTVALALWGPIAVIVGLFLAGVGVVPVGMLAAVFHGEWGILGTLVLLVVLTYGSRIIGLMLVGSNESAQSDLAPSEVIDVEPIETKRTWGDLE